MQTTEEQEHNCENIEDYPLDRFLQLGSGNGEKVLIVGESLARNGWRVSGKAFYSPEGKVLPTGRILNKLIERFDLSIESCGFTEIAKCYIGQDRNQLDECGKKCWPIFAKQIVLHDFKLVILLGKKTLEIFNKCAGTSLETGKIEKINLNKKEYRILPIFHTSPANPYGYIKNKEILDNLEKEINVFLGN
jgi:uracil-DNA glycosylase family 4